MQSNARGRGRLAVNLQRIPASEADPSKATTSHKKGLEVVREDFQHTADSKPVARVCVIDHDANRTLFSGSPEEFARLKKAIAGKKGGAS